MGDERFNALRAFLRGMPLDPALLLADVDSIEAERDRLREALLRGEGEDRQARSEDDFNEWCTRCWSNPPAHKPTCIYAALSQPEGSTEACPTCGKTRDAFNWGMSENLRFKLCRDPFHRSTDEGPTDG